MKYSTQFCYVFADSSLLKTIDGAHLICVVKNYPALVSMMHLLPENVLVSGDENIPGLAASPTGKLAFIYVSHSTVIEWKTVL